MSERKPLLRRPTNAID